MHSRLLKGFGLLTPIKHTEPALSSPPKPRDVSAEARLVALAQQGDSQAWRKLYEQFAPAVHACILANVPSSDSEDLAQDVFVSALANLDTLSDRERFGGWIMTLARNRRTDYWRRHKESPEVDPDNLKDSQAPRAEARQALDAIRNLPKTYHEPLLMRLVEGMTGPEIAQQLGMTHGSVRVNLNRGMKLLREALHKEESE